MKKTISFGVVFCEVYIVFCTKKKQKKESRIIIFNKSQKRKLRIKVFLNFVRDEILPGVLGEHGKRTISFMATVGFLYGNDGLFFTFRVTEEGKILLLKGTEPK